VVLLWSLKLCPAPIASTVIADHRSGMTAASCEQDDTWLGGLASVH
jgi:hypothetical protein